MGHDGVFEGVHVQGVGGGELFEGALLPVEELQHHHAGNVLLQERIDTCNGDPNAPIGIAHFIAEHFGGNGDQRQHGEGNERQLPVHMQHDRHDAGEHEHVFENRDHARGEHFVQRVHVSGDARDQPAYRVLVIKADMHVLQVPEDLAA